MKEFFGFGGYTRKPEGVLSWQHLTFVTILVSITIGLAIYLGIKNKKKDEKSKNKVLIWCAIIIASIEICKDIILCWRSNNPMHWLYELPLFICSLQCIAIPIAAFSKGKLKEACLDFIFIFGLVGALLGTYGAANIYNVCPVLSIDSVASGITHTLGGFASLYIAISGMVSMKKKNILISFAILFIIIIPHFVL